MFYRRTSAAIASRSSSIRFVRRDPSPRWVSIKEVTDRFAHRHGRDYERIQDITRGEGFTLLDQISVARDRQLRRHVQSCERVRHHAQIKKNQRVC